MKQRLAEHIARAKNPRERDYKLIHWVQSLDTTPLITEIHSDYYSDIDSLKLERDYIRRELENGTELYNTNDTGVDGKNVIVNEEKKRKISETLSTRLTGKVLYNSKKIYVFNLEGKLLNEFDTIANCSRFYNIPQGKIGQIAKGKGPNKSYKGMVFSYTKEDLKINKKITLIVDIKENKGFLFNNVKEAESFVAVGEGYLSRKVNKEIIIRGKYKVYNNSNPEALLKFRELLETLEIDNQQPSLEESSLKVQRLELVAVSSNTVGEHSTSAGLNLEF